MKRACTQLQFRGSLSASLTNHIVKRVCTHFEVRGSLSASRNDHNKKSRFTRTGFTLRTSQIYFCKPICCCFICRTICSSSLRLAQPMFISSLFLSFRWRQVSPDRVITPEKLETRLYRLSILENFGSSTISDSTTSDHLILRFSVPIGSMRTLMFFSL